MLSFVFCLDSPGQKNSSAIGEGIPLSKTGGSAGIPIAQSSVWSPKQNTDPLHDIRTSIQNGSLFKFAESTLANQFGSMHLLGQRVSTSSSDTNSSNSGNSNGNNLNSGRNPSKHQSKYCYYTLTFLKAVHICIIGHRVMPLPGDKTIVCCGGVGLSSLA